MIHMHVKIMRTGHLYSPSNPVLDALIWIFDLIMRLNEPSDNKVRYLQGSMSSFKIILYTQADKNP